ncbi:MAG: T9SS type A sorting domain-containing protein [Bacteroidales bacterium]|nr:T9SS type A sorting domain-containing protein [Bacteroidales bacterium]
MEYSPNLLGFHTYMLDEPVLVNGTFYIGWEQQSGDNLNLGYDRYNDVQQNIFYNASGEWFQSIYQGALMMRPVLGKKFSLTGLEENPESAGAIVPYPNPLNGNRIMFKCTGIYENKALTNGFRVSINSILGAEVFSGAFLESLEIGQLSPGLYILCIKNDKGERISSSKLIIN